MSSKLKKQQSNSSYVSSNGDEEDYSFDDDFGSGNDDDFGEDDYNSGMEVDESSSQSNKSSDGSFQFEVLQPKDLIVTQLSSIESVSTMLEIPSSIARILLQHFGWDKDRLIDRYFNDPDKVFDEANIINPHKTQNKGNKNKEMTCEICYVDYLCKEMCGLPCNHMFCISCWKNYLRTKILDEGAGQAISCPAHNCKILVDEVTVINLLGDDEKILNKYRYFTAKAFVANNRHVKWCPSAGCENAIKVSTVASKPVKCNCGFAFCFGCVQPVHDPVFCSTLKLWLKKCADDSETANWISANTKECPKCKTTIEKNGGCNHMTCRSPNCKFEFCWTCLGPWEPHGSSWYSCNRFEEKKTDDGTEKHKSRQSLERYLHYYNRYTNHEQSQKFEQKLYQTVENKMAEYQQKGMSWIEVQFLKKAVEILCQCRQTLKYTYVFGYYLKKNNQAFIFEDNQKDLENAVETLSQYLEQDIDHSSSSSSSSTASSSSMSSSFSSSPALSSSAGGAPQALLDVKQKVLDKSQYCDSRRKVLLDHVFLGYDDNVWEFDASGN